MSALATSRELEFGTEDFRALLAGADATRADVWSIMTRRLADSHPLGR
jgi:hypothetical protein